MGDIGKFHQDVKHDFDLEVVLSNFKRCLHADGTIDISSYLAAFRELCRFFRLTGKLFAFVARDLENKMGPIEAKRACADTGSHYVTLQSMVAWETERGWVGGKGHHPSGTRNFLRLHRALEFILQFMRQLRHSDADAKTARIASEVYGCTLSRHHPWVTRRIASLAVYMLPSKQALIDVMCRHDYTHVHALIDSVTQHGQPIFDVTQDLYAQRGLLKIP